MYQLNILSLIFTLSQSLFYFHIFFSHFLSFSHFFCLLLFLFPLFFSLFLSLSFFYLRSFHSHPLTHLLSSLLHSLISHSLSHTHFLILTFSPPAAAEWLALSSSVQHFWVRFLISPRVQAFTVERRNQFFSCIPFSSFSFFIYLSVS